MSSFSISQLSPWSRPFGPELIRLAWPICASLLSWSVMTLVDTLFIGQLGAAALGGVGLGAVASFFALSFGVGVFASGKVAISQAIGAERFDRIQPLVGATIFLAGCLGLTVVVVGQGLALGLPLLVRDSQVGELAQHYTGLRTLGGPVSVMAVALAQTRIAMGDSSSSMRASLIANIANIPLNALLIYGLQWGVRGAAIGSVLAQLLQVWTLLRVQRGDGFGLSAWTRKDVQAIWHFGLPGGLERLLDTGAFVALTTVLAQLPTEELAAHQIAIQISHFSFLPLHAIAEASSVLTAKSVGAGRDAEVRPCAHTARHLALYVASVNSLITLFLATEICRPFSPNEGVGELAAHLLLVGIPLCLINAYYSSYRGALRGTGDVHFTTRVTVLSAWLITPPLAIWCALHLGMGATGLWVALNVEIGVGAGWVVWRLARNGWSEAAVGSRRRLANQVR